MWPAWYSSSLRTSRTASQRFVHLACPGVHVDLLDRVRAGDQPTPAGNAAIEISGHVVEPDPAELVIASSSACRTVDDQDERPVVRRHPAGPGSEVGAKSSEPRRQDETRVNACGSRVSRRRAPSAWRRRKPRRGAGGAAPASEPAEGGTALLICFRTG